MRRLHAQPQTATRIDPRLREVVAMALCWAEWPGPHEHINESPAEYWAKMTPEARAQYYGDAESFAAAMMGCDLVLVSQHPTPAMIEAARLVRPALRRDGHVEDVWREMLDARREKWADAA